MLMVNYEKGVRATRPRHLPSHNKDESPSFIMNKKTDSTVWALPLS
jgi:hypothetical protein